MIRTLFIIAGAALVLAIASLGGAAALGGREMAREGWSWTVHDGDRDIRIERMHGDRSPDVSKTLAWTGGGLLAIDMPADVTFIQGADAGVVLTGPQSTLDRVRVSDGRIALEDADDRISVGLRTGSRRDRLTIVVTAPDVSRFRLAGSGDLDIRAYDQPSLEITIAGSGDVTASGKTTALKLDIAGSGEADLSDILTTDADVSINGSGEATVGPTGTARISIAGSGDVTLTTRPTQLQSNVSGSGDIHQR